MTIKSNKLNNNLKMDLFGESWKKNLSDSHRNRRWNTTRYIFLCQNNSILFFWYLLQLFIKEDKKWTDEESIGCHFDKQFVDI